MVIQKKAQFFLLAAVIISAVILSLGFVANKATVNREPGSFYDFSYEVIRETGAVIDYEIYTLSEGNLTDFVGLLSQDIRDRDPNANFIFIYGDNRTGNMSIRNEGSDPVSVGDQDYPGAGAISISQTCQYDICTPISQYTSTFDPEAGIGTIDVTGATDVVVTIGDNDYSFPISEHKQVIFIIQKETDDENFISVK